MDNHQFTCNGSTIPSTPSGREWNPDIPSTPKIPRDLAVTIAPPAKKPAETIREFLDEVSKSKLLPLRLRKSVPAVLQAVQAESEVRLRAESLIDASDEAWKGLETVKIESMAFVGDDEPATEVYEREPATQRNPVATSRAVANGLFDELYDVGQEYVEALTKSERHPSRILWKDTDPRVECNRMRRAPESHRYHCEWELGGVAFNGFGRTQLDAVKACIDAMKGAAMNLTDWTVTENK